MNIKITWLGQAGYLLKYNNMTICIDPYLSNSIEKIDGLRRLKQIPVYPENLIADYLIITHDHLDHFDEDTINKIVMDNMVFIGPTSCINHLAVLHKNCKAATVLNRGDSIRIGEVAIHAVFSEHTDDSIGIVIEICDNKKSIYFTGDTEFNEELLKIKSYSPDLIIGCINGKWGNMNCYDLARLAAHLETKKVIPSHYGMFAENTEDPKKLERILKNYNIEFQELNYFEEIEVII